MIDPMISVTRCAVRVEKTKFEMIVFLKTNKGNLMTLAEKERERLVIIDAQQELAQVKKDVEMAVNEFLNKG
jgi:thymidylate kinase